MRKSVLLGLLSLVSVQAFAFKVGVVDLQKALQDSKKGKAAKANLEKEFQAKKKEIDKQQESLRKMSEEFQKKSLVLSEKARAEKGMELQQKMGAWQELVQKSQSDIQAKEAEMTRPLIDGLRAQLNDLAKKKDVDVVYEANAGMLYAKDRVEMTEELVKLYDEKNPK